jgi:hypothetical protein
MEFTKKWINTQKEFVGCCFIANFIKLYISSLQPCEKLASRNPKTGESYSKITEAVIIKLISKQDNLKFLWSFQMVQ